MKKQVISGLSTYEITGEQPDLKPENLLTYVIDILWKNGIEPLFPQVVAGSHKLFPGVFALSGDYPEYPNSLIVKETMAKMLPTLLETDKEPFRLTSAGKQAARDVSAILIKNVRIAPMSKPKLNITNSTSQNYASLQLSKVYSQYLLDKVVDYRLLWEHLGADPQADQKVLKKYFREINSYANMIGDKSIGQFTQEIIDAID